MNTRPPRALPSSRLWSLRTQARALVCLLLVLAAGALGEWWARRALDQAQAATGQRLVQQVRQLADRLSHEMATRTHELLQLSQLEVLREPADPAAARAALEQLRDTLPAPAWIGLTDAQGTVVAATGDERVGHSLAAWPAFEHGRQGLWTGDVREAPPLAPPAGTARPGEGVKRVDVAAPVYLTDGSLHGVLVLQLDWDWAAKLRDALAGPGSDGVELLVFNARGDLLLAPPGAAAPWPHLSRERMTGLEERWAHEHWSDGHTALSAAAQSIGRGGFPGFGWTVVARNRHPDAPATRADARLEVLPWAGAAAAGCAGLAWWLIGLLVAPAGPRAPARPASPTPPLRRDGVLPRRRNDVQQIASAVADLQHTLRERFDSTPAALEGPSQVDPLTGLWNPSYLQALSERLTDDPTTMAEMEFCVLCLDLDGLQPVVDRFGRGAGDEMRVQVGKRLRKITREDDFAFRLEGDTFLLVLPCPVGEAAHLSHQVAQRVVGDLQRPMHYLTLSNLRISGSIGSAVWPRDGDTLNEVVRRAGEALQAAQAAGRGQYREYVRAAEPQPDAERESEADLDADPVSTH